MLEWFFSIHIVFFFQYTYVHRLLRRLETDFFVLDRLAHSFAYRATLLAQCAKRVLFSRDRFFCVASTNIYATVFWKEVFI